MADVVVKDHIFNFMKSETVGEARNILNVPDATEVNNLLTTFEEISAAFSYGNYVEMVESMEVDLSMRGAMLYWGGTTNISLSVNPSINLNNFSLTVAQLSTGTITITKRDDYNCSLISYGELYETAGQGSVASIISIPSDRYLITGLLQ